jgi:26S proteasome regulatory subunit N9
MHPILDALKMTQDEWLQNLLFAFNEGSITKFDSLAPLFPKEVSYGSLMASLCS